MLVRDHAIYCNAIENLIIVLNFQRFSFCNDVENRGRRSKNHIPLYMLDCLVYTCAFIEVFRKMEAIAKKTVWHKIEHQYSIL